MDSDNFDWYKNRGYFLVEDTLVPYSFLERLDDHLSNNNFTYGCVLTLEEICGEEFWNSLKSVERKVLGACILMLMEDHLPVILPDDMADY
jgi:hypothetical protein